MGYTVDNFNTLATTTLTNYVEKELRDAIFQADPGYAYMRDKGAMRMDGGDPLRIPLMYAANEAGGSFNGYDLLDITPADGFGFAYYAWKEYHQPITISKRERKLNNGKSAVISLLESKIMQSQESMINNMITGFYGDGTGNDSKDLTGLGAVMASSGTYGGIATGTYTWWAPQTETTAEAIGKENVRDMIYDIQGSGAYRGNDATQRQNNKDQRGAADLIIMPKDLYSAFEDLYEPHVRLDGYGASKFAELGFPGLSFHGADITWSDNMTAGEVYFLSTKYLSLITHEDVDFEVTPFQSPVNQAASVAHIFWMGELVTSNRKRLGFMTNKTT